MITTHIFRIYLCGQKGKGIFVQVAKSRSYVSWSSRLEGACRYMRHLPDDMYTNSRLANIEH